MKLAKEKQSPQKSTIEKGTAQKILRSVSFDQGFHFSTGTYTSETAINLFSFYEELKTIDLQSVKFHFQRRDFQKWVETTLNDPQLASTMDNISPNESDEKIKQELLEAVNARLTELQTIANKPDEEQGVATSEERQKMFTIEQLKQFNGKDGNLAYVAFSGKVYDVTGSSFWMDGKHMSSHDAGNNLTEAIQSAPHGDEVFSKFRQIGILK